MPPWSAAHRELSVLFLLWGVLDHTSEMPNVLQTLLCLGLLSLSPTGHSCPVVSQNLLGPVLAQERPSWH